jgi:ABC transporter
MERQAMAKAGAGSEPTLDEPAPVLIALRDVSRLYDGGAIAAVRNIDLEIETGDCVAIVGASGSGKSSLLNLLCGIDYPTSGTVSWEGHTVHTPRHWAQLRRNSIRYRFPGISPDTDTDGPTERRAGAPRPRLVRRSPRRPGRGGARPGRAEWPDAQLDHEAVRWRTSTGGDRPRHCQ